MTLVTLRLRDDAEVRKAAKIMEQTVAQFDWTADQFAEISGINTFQGEDQRPRLFYVQLRGTDTKVLINELQERLAADLRRGGLAVVEVTDILHVTILRRGWALSGSWASHGLLETAAEYRIPPAPVKEVVLCKRYSSSPGKFYETFGRAELARIGDGGEDGVL
jgi:2'-5' RNA ligase